MIEAKRMIEENRHARMRRMIEAKRENGIRREIVDICQSTS